MGSAKHSKSFQLAPMSRSTKILTLMCVGGLFFAVSPFLVVMVFNGGDTSEANGGMATLLWLTMFTFPVGMGAAAIGFLGTILLSLRDVINKFK
ncbi:MAG: hypothetical protein ACO1RX_23545 [Candidatus Sericytochromatia bacterium]